MKFDTVEIWCPGCGRIMMEGRLPRQRYFEMYEGTIEVPFHEPPGKEAIHCSKCGMALVAKVRHVPDSLREGGGG